MSNELFKIATDPYQYDQTDAGWEKIAAQGLNDPHRQHFLYYVETVVPSWLGRNLLDIGAGSAWLMNYALHQGAQAVAGFDPAQNNVALAQELFGLELAQATIETYCPPAGQSFDLAVAIYVLTHVSDLETAFRNISSWLVPGGEFVTIVPDLEYAKRSRANFLIETEPLIENPKYESYVIRINRDHGAIADIVRDVRIYAGVAARYGLVLTVHTEMKATDILVAEHPRYASFREQNLTLTHLLKFTKANV